MERVARSSAAERSALFAETAARMKTTPAVAEKDFWVTWVLDRLFADAELARLMIFKGGTSLSKAYRLIERFSEDIDLILDWRVLTTVEADYRAMTNMIFGAVPAFDEILASLRALEVEINSFATLPGPRSTNPGDGQAP